ncbi:MAG: hypothetical protein ABI652_03390 [Acidobacteriota bacterium]
MASRALLEGRRSQVTRAADEDVDAGDELRTLVTISRAHPSDIQMREVFVRLDGGRRVRLEFGQSFTDEVRPGAHHLRVHNTLVWKNVHFVVEPGEHLEFVVINVGYWWTFGIAGVLGAAPLFLRVERRSLA